VQGCKHAEERRKFHLGFWTGDLKESMERIKGWLLFLLPNDAIGDGGYLIYSKF